VINTIAQLLEALRNAEAELLKKQDIRHAPTIGDMYEGLTKDILDRAIPSSLGLQIVSGFIEGEGGEKSNQIDVMLVSGNGKKIPYTDSFVWHIKDVLAVFEVKKTLYGSELADAFNKMWKVAELALEFEKQGGYDNKDVSFGYKTFAKITGYFPEFSKRISLGEPLSTICNATIFEQVAPVRVIVGYEGYVDENGLRRGIGDFIEENIGTARGYLSFPSLIISRSNSVAKLNGFPYYVPIVEPSDWWGVLASNSENPTRILLEMLWTKISSTLEVSLPMDDTLEKEKFSLLLRQKYMERTINGHLQGGFAWDLLDKVKMRSQPPKEGVKWQPTLTDEVETAVLLRATSDGFIAVNDIEFAQFAEENGTTAQEILESMVNNRVLAWTDASRSVARPIESTTVTTFTPSGEVVVTDQFDLLNLWVEDRLAEKRGQN
jgi:hypothetical protein